MFFGCKRQETQNSSGLNQTEVSLLRKQRLEKGPSKAGMELRGLRGGPRPVLPRCPAGLGTWLLLPRSARPLERQPFHLPASRKEGGRDTIRCSFSSKTFPESNSCCFHDHSLGIDMLGENVICIVGNHCSRLGSFINEEGNKDYWALPVS